MAPALLLFMSKSKYRRKDCWWTLGCLLMALLAAVDGLHGAGKCGTECVNGFCANGTCNCYDGWQGPNCQFCGGKVRLSEPSGYILDGQGNYSVDVKCSWLVSSGTPNATIRLHLEEFATECGWDHLYVYDGDSVRSPLLAVFSGLMYKDDYRVRRVPEVVAKSGSALLHFYSDVAYNMTGFNISYRLNSCPSRFSDSPCSGHGVCIDGSCTCDALYIGDACEIPVCPNDCSGKGQCNREKHRCECWGDARGDDCSQSAEKGFWELLQPKAFVPEGSASHGVVVWRDSLYVVGGESYEKAKLMYVYDFTGNIWETVHINSKNVPQSRYGHSTVIFGDKIFMYGGVDVSGHVSAELWAFDISANAWENITVRAESCTHQKLNPKLPCGPLRSTGHTATVVSSKVKKSEKMIVIFGHSPIYGYLNTVQEYNFGTRTWQVVATKGFPVKGGYGHSSVYDGVSQRIYVYGGYVSESASTALLTNKLFSYDPFTKTWNLLMSAPSARFLHSAVISRGLMLVFGGNTHNDTAFSHGAKCYSHDFLAYDLACDTWSALPTPALSRTDLSRYGHSSVMFDGALYIYGGFDGQFRSDLLKFTPGKCSVLNDEGLCSQGRPGVKCVWSEENASCEISGQGAGLGKAQCSTIFDNGRSEICSMLDNCGACVHTAHSCIWCGGSQGSCNHQRCKESNQKAITNIEQCETQDSGSCLQLHNCQACGTNPKCRWEFENRCKSIVSGNVTSEAGAVEIPGCLNTCAQFSSCQNCTQEECIWCQNEARCVNKNAYTASFPYGQCREWTTHITKCRPSNAGEAECSFYATCEECRVDPACGWCDDGSGTGLGKCLRGGNHRPDDPSMCPSDSWFFTRCPACQCNGHSTCGNGSSQCTQPCNNLTQGMHCERCVPGYYGNPVNGGKCTPCHCNNQGTQCHPETGKCYCTTKGITGDHCDKCDTTNHYSGDPANGSCFYDLTIDYQFTFNLSKKEDRHYSQINFKNIPTKHDVDADFQITCSVPSKMNITVRTATGAEKYLLVAHNCSTLRHRFSKSEYQFGIEDNVTQTTFFVYVYDFQPPLWIQISFSQYPKLNLQQFFITFSTCFVLLLLVAAVMWKIKVKYDLFRRRQRMFVEMEQMASRPFAQVSVEVERKPPDDQPPPSLRKRKKDAPSPIALEPCCGNRAAVLSLLVRLPSGSQQYTPPGQTGLAIASALVTLGNPRKVSSDPPNKGDAKNKTQVPNGIII
ncbi:attractin-like protein 1 isoform X2 [Cloeon dipterum]|uniref:attractin-like protein 1 isoform X2 n=1 Tax=Cloeon dipterum TaxID=197152 RepID=UPI00321F69D7